jgi:antitoxin component of MazEF toxin-antitoxin module
MKTTEVAVTRIRNSRGIRLPAEVLRRYQVQGILLMEQRPDEIALRPKRARGGKLTWAETYQQMAQANEDWIDWEAAGEGLSSLPGEVAG